MKQQMCARCGERPAVIYIQKMVRPGAEYRLY